MVQFDAQSYGPFIAEILRKDHSSPLGPGNPTQPVPANLAGFAANLEKAFRPHRIQDHVMARACLAGLWLYHDYLDESHQISQEVETPTGSYWHGIMHRREKDFDNAKYWFRQVGKHPVFALLREDAAELAAPIELLPAARFLRTQPAWNASAFIDLCEACLDGRSSHNLLCQVIQQREWELLFDHCYRQACGLA
jgi:hypothetical protein